MKPIIKNYLNFSNPILNAEDGVPNYVMLYVQHAPRESTPLHIHPWEHQAFITEGSGILFFENDEYPIKTGDCIYVPANSEHQFRNTGDVKMSRVTINPISSTQ